MKGTGIAGATFVISSRVLVCLLLWIMNAVVYNGVLYNEEGLLTRKRAFHCSLPLYQTLCNDMQTPPKRDARGGGRFTDFHLKDFLTFNWHERCICTINTCDFFFRCVWITQDSKHHPVWELGHSRAVPVLVGLQPASDLAAAASLFLVVPHSEDSVPGHLQRKGGWPHSRPSTQMSQCIVLRWRSMCNWCVGLLMDTSDVCFLSPLLACDPQGGEMESFTCE